MHRISRISIPILLAACTAAPLAAQQGPDTTWVPSVERPAYRGKAPRVGIDEAHHNFHTIEGRYGPFARLLALDGYHVSASTQPFTRESLDAFDVLVIANARGGDDLLTAGDPAFTPGERAAVREWVRGGGSLLLVADHAPFGAAAEALAQEFGVGMSKGFTLDTAAGRSTGNPSFLRFTLENDGLGDHPILAGRDLGDFIVTVVTFTGQSLSVPPGASALLRLSPTAVDRAPPSAEEMRQQAARRQARVDSVVAAIRAGGARDTAVALAVPLATGPQHYTSAAGRAQGVALTFGAGRVVVLGEAAMLSAQVIEIPGRETMHMGMNVPGSDDQKFALNVMHWLSHLY